LSVMVPGGGDGLLPIRRRRHHRAVGVVGWLGLGNYYHDVNDGVSDPARHKRHNYGRLFTGTSIPLRSVGAKTAQRRPTHRISSSFCLVCCALPSSTYRVSSSGSSSSRSAVALSRGFIDDAG